MSIAISIQFLAGRYHATPWDHQVNEGVVEWPPSPWRILRTLVSAYYRLPSPPPRDAVCQLLDQLADELPCYVLPPYSEGHSRHYMPIRKEGKNTTTKVFDTFLVIGSGTLSPDAVVRVVWPNVVLKQAEIQLLQQLCSQVSYLGRAESWAELSVSIEATEPEYSAIPAETVANSDAQTKLLAPLGHSGLEGFRAALSVLPKPKGKKNKWSAPADVLEALELNVTDLHAQGWNGIPGARWVPYILQSPSKTTSRPSLMPAFAAEATCARFALTSSVLPSLTEAISVGERFHQALSARSKGDMDWPDSVFSGRDENNEPMVGHQHAWYLPEVNSEGRIDHVVVYAAGGFQSKRAIDALCSLKEIWSKEGEKHTIQTILLSLGHAEDYSSYGAQLSGRSPLLAKGYRWMSLTPMVLPRYPKQRRNGEKKFIPDTNFQADGPEDQALLMLQNLGMLPSNDYSKTQCEIEDASWLGLQDAEGNLLCRVRKIESSLFHKNRWHRFQCHRPHGKQGRKFSDKGYGIEIVFNQPQPGPIALGYAAHFGLGVFVPVE